MSSRRMSTRDTRIVSTDKDSRLPSAGAPSIRGVSYNPQPLIDISDDINEDGPTETTIEAPRNLEIVEQKVRFAPDGTQYVTVIIQFDEVPNAEYYETRISKG